VRGTAGAAMAALRARGQAAREQAGGRAARGRYLSGPAAPWAMARHCRAKIGGVADPATSPVNNPGRRHVILPPHHHAWRGTGVSPRHGNRRDQKC